MRSLSDLLNLLINKLNSSSTQYFTCDATTMSAITTTLKTCAGTEVCTDTAAICVTGGTAACTSPVLPVFLPAIWTAAKFCSTRADGRYPYPLEAGCKKYVHCNTYNGIKWGQLLACTSINPNLIFDPLHGCVPVGSYTCV